MNHFIFALSAGFAVSLLGGAASAATVSMDGDDYDVINIRGVAPEARDVEAAIGETTTRRFALSLCQTNQQACRLNYAAAEIYDDNFGYVGSDVFAYEDARTSAIDGTLYLTFAMTFAPVEETQGPITADLYYAWSEGGVGPNGTRPFQGYEDVRVFTGVIGAPSATTSAVPTPVAPVPLPATGLMLLGGLVAFGGYRRGRRAS